jgi:hypothetical protein
LDDLPSGDFQVGVNLFRPPDPKTPYRPTKWSGGDSSSIHLSAGERKQISLFRLPPPSAVRSIEAQVRWPDGSPAAGVSVWGEIGDHAAALAKTDTNGLTHLDLLEGIAYSIEAKTWVGQQRQREVARSGAIDVTPGPQTVPLNLVLTKRTKDYR